MIEFSQIRSFVTLSQHLHFGKAAKVLGITQPSLSQQIKNLEQTLKAVLLERSPHAVRLTAAGQAFLPKAQKILEACEDAEQTAKHDRESLAGVVRLAFIPTVGPYLLPKLMKILQKQAPQIQLELFELTTTLLLEQIKQGQFDLGVLALPVADAGLVSKSLGFEEFYLAMAKTHALAQKSTVHVSDVLKDDVLMLKEGHCFRDQALTFCAQHSSKSMNVVFEGSSLVSVMNLVSAGMGLTLVPHMAMASASKDLHFVPFAKPKPQRELGVVWRMSYGLKAREQLLIRILQSFRHI